MERERWLQMYRAACDLDKASCRGVFTAAVVVGVDTGLTFLAAAVGTPTVAIYCATSPVHVGIEVDTPHLNLGEIDAPPSAQAVIDAACGLARG